MRPPSGPRLLVALLLALAGCHARPPVVAAVPEPPPPPPPIVAPEPHTPTHYAAAGWTFSVADRFCAARTRNKALGLSLMVGPDPKIDLTLQASPLRLPLRHDSAPAQVDFSGQSAEWTAHGHIRGRTVNATLPLDERGLRRLLALLDGGEVSARSADRVLPHLDIPDAGVAGRDWFACARARLAGVAVPPAAVTGAEPRPAG